jgi:arylsulfatase
MPRPNILVLMTDQQRHDALRCSGNHEINTPNLNALAASGVRFSQAVTPTPVCVAARMSFITGHRVSQTHWVGNNVIPGPIPELPTMMGTLLNAGYRTQGIGKMHFRGRHFGLQHLQTMEECVDHYVDDDYLRYLRANDVRTRFPKGFRDLLMMQPQTCGIPVEHHMNTWVADRSVEFLREHTRHRTSQPFFLWSSWISPHPPFAPCEPYDAMYDPDEMALPHYADRPIEELPPGLRSQRGRLDGSHRDPDRIRRVRALYNGLVTHVDDGVGRILAELDALGIADNTVVLFVSDHGEMLGDHGIGQKFCPYEHSIRIPFLLRWPGRTEAGRVSDDLVSLLDVYPTVLSELNIPYATDPPPLTGASLLGRPGGGLGAERDVMAIDFGAERSRWIALRSQDRMYIYFANGGVEECYDLATDPWESQNLIRHSPSWAAEWRRRLVEWEQTHGLESSFEGPALRSYEAPPPPREEDCRNITLNEGAWPKRMPSDDRDNIESFPEAFDRMISKEPSLSPDKLSIAQYRQLIESSTPDAEGGEGLMGTKWEAAWLKAEAS